MDRYAVVGHPVEHSLSPRIHALFARQTAQSLVYDRLDCEPGHFAQTLKAFAANQDAHGQKRWATRGCNVTVPFKFEAFGLAPRHSERAELAKAANTLGFDSEEPGGWWADNTDGAGLVRDIEHNAGFALKDQRVLLIGAGGAGAGVLGPLLERRPRELVLINRTPAKAVELAERHAELARRSNVTLGQDDLRHDGQAYDVVINASASSLSGNTLGLPLSVCRPGGLAIDLMYGPAALSFLRWAQDAGARARDGLGMLVEQAAESFERWRGVRPQTAPVLAELRDFLKHRDA